MTASSTYSVMKSILVKSVMFHSPAVVKRLLWIIASGLYSMCSVDEIGITCIDGLSRHEARVEISLASSTIRQTTVAPFTGAWIEIRRAGRVPVRSCVSLPSRERGLKFGDTPLVAYLDRSLPSRERGLKLGLLVFGGLAIIVAPFTGAWIEIPWMPPGSRTVAGLRPSREGGV